jgi:hypothetical protein
MTKWFVVGTESITAEQEKSFIAYIHDEHGFGWWHWIPNFWLITGSGSISCDEIRDKLLEIAPGKDSIVVEVNPVTWTGFGPNQGKENMFAWFYTTWDDPTKENKKQG